MISTQCYQKMRLTATGHFLSRGVMTLWIGFFKKASWILVLYDKSLLGLGDTMKKDGRGQDLTECSIT